MKGVDQLFKLILGLFAMAIVFSMAIAAIQWAYEVKPFWNAFTMSFFIFMLAIVIISGVGVYIIKKL